MGVTQHEEALLGAVLSGYRDIAQLARIIDEPDFYSASQGAVWQACVAVHKRGDQPNPINVRDYMGAAVMRLPDGPLYLSNLSEATVLGADPLYLANQIRQQALKRRMVEVGQRIVQVGESGGDETAQDLAAKVRGWVEQVGTTKQAYTSMSEALEQVIDIAENGERKAMLTPWPDLDRLIGGFYPGQLVTFAARPGVGKSIALANVALEMASHGQWVAMCSLEMLTREVVQRLVANSAAVDLSKLRKAECTEQDWERIMQAQAHLSALPLHIQDSRPQTFDDIRAHAWEVRQAARRAGSELAAVVVDYIQIIRPDSAHRSMSRQQQVGQITQSLKNLAGELDVPVITAAQLNRGAVSGPDTQPELAHLREAGDIEQDSDTVILMHDRMVQDGNAWVETGEMEFIAAKARAGLKGVAYLKKWGCYSRIESARR